MISAFNTLLGFGACTAAGIALGEGDKKSIRRYSSFCLYTSLFLGMSITVLFLFLTDPLLCLLGANEETAGYASSYLRILSAGAPFMVAAGSLGNLSRADGECKGALISSLLGTGVNIVLDPLFILLFKWGVEGTAWATVAGNLCSFCLILFTIRKKAGMSLSIRDYSWKKEVSLRVLSLGIPTAAGTALMSFFRCFRKPHACDARKHRGSIERRRRKSGDAGRNAAHGNLHGRSARHQLFLRSKGSSAHAQCRSGDRTHRITHRRSAGRPFHPAA